MSDELINDIKAARASNSAVRLDVTPILKKHIPIDSLWDATQGRLESIGFTCHSRPQSGTGSKGIYDCKASLGPWYALGFGDELQMMVEVLGNKITAMRGELIYRSL